MLLNLGRGRDSAVLRRHGQDRTLAFPPVSIGVEIGRVGIALKESVLASPPSPVLLLHCKDLHHLFFQIVSECPTILIKAKTISLIIEVMDLGHEVLFHHFILLPLVGTPASQELAHQRGSRVPEVNWTPASGQICR